MHHSSFSERGQALVVIAFAMIGLVAITGLAIDGGMALSDRRHAQNAADTAAMAGALALIHPQTDNLGNTLPWKTVALNRANSNGYMGDLVRSEVEVNLCSDEGASCPEPYAGNSKFLQVVINSHLDTFFAKAVGIPKVHNRVQAVALASEDETETLFGANAIVALAPTGNGCDGEFIVGGSGSKTDMKVHIKGGGVFVNSNNTVDDLESTTCGAFTQDGCATELRFEAGGGVRSVGNINLNKTCSEKIDGPFNEGAEAVAFPPDIVLPEPPECGIGGKIVDIDNKTVAIFPGYYDNIPPKNVKKNIVMQPGNYCLDNFKITNDKTNVTGSNVFIYIRPGGAFDFSGGEMLLDAPDDDKDYKGYLIYVAPPAKGFTACSITGNSSSKFTGTIFAPYCDITVNGSSSPEGIRSQIIGYTVKLNGSGDLFIEYDPGENAEKVIPASLGISQ